MTAGNSISAVFFETAWADGFGLRFDCTRVKNENSLNQMAIFNSFIERAKSDYFSVKSFVLTFFVVDVLQFGRRVM
ncbi:hypothetical protein C943_01519 [Mariniradius saccharolyticus AK6]|uniref:Uncharacterized protein n=1 Tax=Mariniradius saccharolyticus AK6 TaxID=1239962 RepID=M7Y4S7_9BACT|nr:hypothetical protein C943_01519 [Mariniradius saccharolyticus AK6]